MGALTPNRSCAHALRAEPYVETTRFDFGVEDARQHFSDSAPSPSQAVLTWKRRPPALHSTPTEGRLSRIARPQRRRHGDVHTSFQMRRERLAGLRCASPHRRRAWRAPTNSVLGSSLPAGIMHYPQRQVGSYRLLLERMAAWQGMSLSWLIPLLLLWSAMNPANLSRSG